MVGVVIKVVVVFVVVGGGGGDDVVDSVAVVVMVVVDTVVLEKVEVAVVEVVMDTVLCFILVVVVTGLVVVEGESSLGTVLISTLTLNNFVALVPSLLFLLVPSIYEVMLHFHCPESSGLAFLTRMPHLYEDLPLSPMYCFLPSK